MLSRMSRNIRKKRAERIDFLGVCVLGLRVLGFSGASGFGLLALRLWILEDLLFWVESV